MKVGIGQVAWFGCVVGRLNDCLAGLYISNHAGEGLEKFLKIFFVEKYLVLFKREMWCVCVIRKLFVIYHFLALSNRNVAVAISALLYIEVVDSLACFHTFAVNDVFFLAVSHKLNISQVSNHYACKGGNYFRFVKLFDKYFYTTNVIFLICCSDCQQSCYKKFLIACECAIQKGRGYWHDFRGC